MFTSQLNDLTINWGGFIDPHSGVVMYKVALGTKPYIPDIVRWKDIGLATSKYSLYDYQHFI